MPYVVELPLTTILILEAAPTNIDPLTIREYHEACTQLVESGRAFFSHVIALDSATHGFSRVGMHRRVLLRKHGFKPIVNGVHGNRPFAQSYWILTYDEG